MHNNLDSSQVRKVLKGLSESLTDCSIVEAIAAGIMVAQNLRNLGRPIGLINLGRNMINDMHSEKEAEILVYSNLINSILNEEKNNYEFLPGYKQINQNCVDQYLNNRPNKREQKGYSNLIEDFNIQKNPHQYEVVRHPYSGYQPYGPMHPQSSPYSSQGIHVANPYLNVKPEHQTENSYEEQTENLNQVSISLKGKPRERK